MRAVLLWGFPAHPVGHFRETRRIAIALGFALHLALELTMNLFLFEWLMMLALTSHLLGEELEAIAGKIRHFRSRLFGGSRSKQDGGPAGDSDREVEAG